MWWPVLVPDETMSQPWVVGAQVAARLRLDASVLGADLIGDGATFRARPLPGGDGEPPPALLSAGVVTALHYGPAVDGPVHLSGCLTCDPYLGVVGPAVPPTEGIVRTIRKLSALHARGATGWVLRPGEVRTSRVDSTSADELDSLAPRGRYADSPPAGELRFLGNEQYVREYGQLLPPQRWIQQGFLVQLDID